jgi:hypothetical protein
MDLDLITQAIRDIKELQPALAWLKEYGAGLTAQDQTSFVLYVRPGFASACVGAKEAAAQLTAIARLHIPAIVQHAIEDAENTIALRREQIAREASEV